MDLNLFKKRSPETMMKIRFSGIILVVVISIGGMLALGKLGMDTLSSLRAFVGAESIYAKGQQGAAFSLLHYAHTGDQAYYDEFLSHIRFSLGDKKARLELEQTNPDLRKVFNAFEEGGNHPEDIDGMINLYTNFRDTDYLKKAIKCWTMADNGVSEMITLGESIHRLIQSGKATEAEIDLITKQLALLNHDLHETEKSFSNTLGDASRWASGLFKKIMVGFAVISVVVCLIGIVLVGRLITSMQQNSKQLEVQNWLKSGQTTLNEQMRVEQDISVFSYNVISFICERIGAGVGAMYLCDEDGGLKMMSGYAFEKRKGLSNRFELGEGLVGQAALEKKYIVMTACPDDYIRIHSGLGASAPKNILAYPLVQNNVLKGALELGSFHEFTDRDIEFLHLAADAVSVAISGIMARRKEAALLEKTQQQAEALTAQQEELRATNEELEEHSRILKASEEKLQAQQEELRVTNEELTEQAQTLEEQKEEIEKKNRALEATRREAEEKARDLELTGKYKSEFLANMSHELRTPLNSILLLSKLLSENKNGNLSEKQAEFAHTIHSSGSDLLNLINEVLDLSKVEAGKMAFNISEFTLDRLSEKVLKTYGKMAEEKGLQFGVTIDPEIPQRIQTDFQRLEQIVKNFISNALKFTEKGSVSVSIGRPASETNLSQSGLTHGKTIAFSVTDTGIGIQKQMQHFVFEAFQQADGSTNRKYGGTGLGLSISRELAKNLGGEIQLSSELGKGSTFTLYLPERFGAVGEVPENVIVSSVHNGTPEKIGTDAKDDSPAIPSHNMDAIRDDRRDLSPDDKSILVIEDDPGFASTLKALANEKGFKTLIAGDGETGLHLADYYRPSAIILDVGLPGIDGWNVMARLKESFTTRHIPVHFISGVEKSWEANKMGAVGFLTKPVSLEMINQVFTKIEKIIEAKVKKLLVVENDDAESRRIKQLLSEDDIMIETVGSGNVALQRLESGTYHCVILGLTLSDMSGADLLRRIRENETTSGLPVIVYTGKDLTDDERVFLDSNSERVIIKDPKSIERLFDETTLFLHRVEANLPEEKRRILKMVHDKESILKDKKLLIVDDDMRNVFALTSILEDKGIRVIVAKNGREGVNRVKENPDLDLVLMDIMMPEMNGYEAMKQIREMGGSKKLPMIALTAKAMRGDRAKCIEAGANDYLSKPVDNDKLISMLRVWLYR